MTPDDYESKLTAYALNDPSLTQEERLAIEASFANDPSARKQVDETKQLAAALTASLAAESMEASRNNPHENVVLPSAIHRENNANTTIGLNHPNGVKSPRPFRLVRYVLASTAAVTICCFGYVSLVGNSTTKTFNYVSAKKEANHDALGITSSARPAESTPLAGISPNRALPSLMANERYTGPQGVRDHVAGPDNPTVPPNDFGTANRFEATIENAFVTVEGQNALSTFGVDVDTASFSIVRKFLKQNQRPPVAAVRLEEMVNYFPYRDPAPEGKDPYRVSVEIAECPWKPQHKLARIALKAKVIEKDKRPSSNLVFLVDVSGSMDEPNRLPWVKQSLRMLVDQLNENDRVAIVVYASACGVVLDSTNATNKEKILAAIDGLQAGGSTNGGSGIQLAYNVAVSHFVEGGTNRVILCTDGDWNVGVTSTDALMELIESKRKTGVFLSVLGFGMGNLRDEMMVKLAGKGNGNYAYIDDLKEARKVLVEQLGGTLVTVAKDVKIQVEFNPARVASYRLLGYEKRALAAKDFADDRKDSGEMGAGHVVTALYELVPTGVAALPAKSGEELKYQAKPEKKPAVAAPAPLAKETSHEAFTLKLRHKLPDSDISTLRELPVLDAAKPYSEASEDFRFSAAVASFAMLLRDSPHKGVATFQMVSELARAAKSYDPGEYRAEFIQLVEKAREVVR